MIFGAAPVALGALGAGLGAIGGLFGGGARADAAAEQARLDELQAQSAAAQAAMEGAADSWRLTVNLATGYRAASEREAQGAAAGALAAGQARAVASASGLSIEHGTTTATMITQARERAVGEGRAQATALRDQTQRQLADGMVQFAMANQARTNNVISLQLAAQQSRAAAAQAANPVTRLLGAASGALGGFQTGVGLGGLFGGEA